MLQVQTSCTNNAAFEKKKESENSLFAWFSSKCKERNSLMDVNSGDVLTIET
jgi:hypothetical protein